jgi:hypothetical protein
MKTPQPALTSATVAVLALGLFVGQILLPRKNTEIFVGKDIGEDTAVDASEATKVLLPNAHDGGELERLERTEINEFFQNPSLADRSAASSKITGSDPVDAPAELTEEDFLFALEQDLEPWERVPVRIGDIGLQKAASLVKAPAEVSDV